MLIDVQKVLFLGPRSQKELFFSKAQEFGAIEFIRGTPSAIPTDQLQLNKGETKTEQKFPDNELETILSALRHLRRIEYSDGKTDGDLINSHQNGEKNRALLIAKRVIDLKEEIDALDKQQKTLSNLLTIAEPFGSFEMSDLFDLAKKTHRKARFFTCLAQRLPKQLPEGMLSISSNEGFWAGFGLFVDLEIPPHFREIELTQSANEIDQQLKALELQRGNCLSDLIKAKNATALLEGALEEKIDEGAKSQALSTTESLFGKQLFVARGWMESGQLAAFQKFIEKDSIYLQTTQKESGDVPPTHFFNQGWGRIGQDLTEIYDTPSNEDRDPSSWILWSFACFFAMIIGDAGYGLLFLAGSLIAWRKLTLKSGQMAKRIAKLSSMLALFCIGWGILSSAFFALPISPQNPIRRFSLISYLAEKKAHYHFVEKDEVYRIWSQRFPATQNLTKGNEIFQVASASGEHSSPMLSKFSDQIMMELALLIGIAHICTSLLRYFKRNWPAIGWAIFLIGSYAYIPKLFDSVTASQYCFGIAPATAHFAGSAMMIFGFGGAIIAAFAQRGAYGILEMMNVIQIGADVLSYLRIYALGLSGAIMANTINEGAMAVNIVFAPFILILGHSVNLILGLMGGVIHGLRLNFLEWYHYSFEGGGKPFKPLQYLRNTR